MLWRALVLLSAKDGAIADGATGGPLEISVPIPLPGFDVPFIGQQQICQNLPWLIKNR
jgi:hypothetical protein